MPLVLRYLLLFELINSIDRYVQVTLLTQRYTYVAYRMVGVLKKMIPLPINLHKVSITPALNTI